MTRFSTKAENLLVLEGAVTYGKVLPQFNLTVASWIEDPDQVILNFQDQHPDWFNSSLIVRSSAKSEDCLNASNAGHFKTVANIRGRKELFAAINDVQESFGEDNKGDQIFIQPMLENISISGVAFTKDPSNGGYYYIVNYDEKTGSGDTVTSGTTNDLKVYCHARGAQSPIIVWLSRLIALLKELEGFFNNDALDVEFAIDSSGELYLFQVRPLIIKSENLLSGKEHFQLLSEVENKFRTLSKPHPYLLGEKSAFGVMPDWNPAEIIGIRPRPLALSLYKELVTDGTWAYQRDNYGYRNLRSFPLLVSFSGLPYIDVRVSFNSFIPAELNDKLADRLVNHYLDSLVSSPNKHDKVEFDIIYSCYTMDLPERLESLKERGFNEDDCQEILESLRHLTNGIIRSDTGLWKQDVHKLDELKQRQKRVLESNLSQIEKVYWLLEDCKRYGTLPFAGLARAGFIAVQLLQSMVRVGVLSSSEYDCFMGAMKTVSSDMKQDLRLGKTQFLKKYGHLRPGTYDIMSPRYDETPDRYFDWTNIVEEQKNSDVFKLSLETMKKLEALLVKHELEHNVLSLFGFIKSAIEGREYAKFVFTKSLSDALMILTQMGKDYGIDADELSYADIGIIIKAYSSSEDVKEMIAASVVEGKQKYLKTCSLILPQLITDESSIRSFEMAQNEPNYITMLSCEGKVVFDDCSRDELEGSILLINNADPGYDWIFSHGIVGFITKYGGANSHMAIRSAELGLPSIIGAGEVLYNQLQEANYLSIDCANKQVIIIK